MSTIATLCTCIYILMLLAGKNQLLRMCIHVCVHVNSCSFQSKLTGSRSQKERAEIHTYRMMEPLYVHTYGKAVRSIFYFLEQIQ